MVSLLYLILLYVFVRALSNSQNRVFSSLIFSEMVCADLFMHICKAGFIFLPYWHLLTSQWHWQQELHTYIYLTYYFYLTPLQSTYKKIPQLSVKLLPISQHYPSLFYVSQTILETCAKLAYRHRTNAMKKFGGLWTFNCLWPEMSMNWMQT